MDKYHFIFDKTVRSQRLKKSFKKYKNYPINKCNIVIVAGGDGFMLRVLKKYYKHKKPFYGINCGTIGFLMNRFNTESLEKRIKKTKAFSINPLEIKVTNFSGKKFKTLAVNEISLLRQSRQTAILNLRMNNKELLKKLVGDGILVSTPAGSTAYNLSVHGSIISINSRKLVITPISPFRPRRWRGKIVGDKSKIIIKNINPIKRPVSAVADNVEVRNATNISIKINKKIKFGLLYDSNRSLQKKIKIEQIRNETN